MTSVEIIGDETEAQLLQTKSASPNNLIERPINVFQSIYDWQPLGYRAVVNLPLLSNDQSPIFNILVNPYVPHIPSDTLQIGAVNAIRAFSHYQSVFHPPGNDFTKDEPVNIIQHSNPPFISYIARGCRYWRGGLSYRIRNIASFVSQGYIVVAPIYGLKKLINNINPFNVRPRYLRSDTNMLESQMNSYVMADTSMSRHVEVVVPFRNTVPVFDHYGELATCIARRRALSSNDFVLPIPTPQSLTAIGVYSRGNIPTTSTSNQIEFEIEIKAEPDFEFGGEAIYFPYAPTSDIEGKFFEAPGNTPNRINLPSVTRVPDFNDEGEPRWTGTVTMITDTSTISYNSA